MAQLSCAHIFFLENCTIGCKKLIHKQKLKQSVFNCCVQWLNADDQTVYCFIISISAMS